jgi:hypothetical protein
MEGAIEVSTNQFAVLSFSVGQKTHQEAFGTEASGHVGCLYWLLIVQNADQNFLPGRANKLLAIVD